MSIFNVKKVAHGLTCSWPILDSTNTSLDNNQHIAQARATSPDEMMPGIAMISHAN